MKPVAIAAARFLLSLRGPWMMANVRLLRTRGETARSLRIRDATAEDIPVLARLHVTTWNATYAPLMKGPGSPNREQQWRDAFAKNDGTWFGLLVERANGELVGFAKGRRATARVRGQTI